MTTCNKSQVATCNKIQVEGIFKCLKGVSRLFSKKGFLVGLSQTLFSLRQLKAVKNHTCLKLSETVSSSAQICLTHSLSLGESDAETVEIQNRVRQLK